MFGEQNGTSMDLTNGWESTKEEHGRNVKEYVQVVKPLLLIGSPMCRMFSQLLTLS